MIKSFLLVLLIGFSASAKGLKIVNPSEFQFIHCVVATQSAKALVPHYIIDVRDSEKHKLYWQVQTAKLKATALKNLNLVDDNLQQNVDESADVSWRSGQELQISLNIIDNDGYALRGQFSNGGIKQTLNCKDASQE